MRYAFLGDAFVDGIVKVIETIMKDVLVPIIEEVLGYVINYLTNIIWNLFSGFLIVLFSALCSLIDFVENIFNVFAGMAPVYVGDSNSPMYLIDALFQMEDISTAFLFITVTAVGVCFIFTIYKTIKSISDMTLEDKNPISKVLKDALKACVTFMMIPFLCIVMLRLSTVVTSNINQAFTIAQGGQSGSVGTILFLSVSMDADKETMMAKDLISGEIQRKVDEKTKEVIPRSPSLSDSLRSLYMNGTRDYRDIDQVKTDFHVANFDYLTGFICGALLLLVLVGSVLTFVRRLFELLLLYVISPLFVSTIPLDEGATFSKWRELFVAKFFSGFGSVFVMKLYLMLVPMMAGSDLILYNQELPNGKAINDILQIFFIVGGAWAVYKAQSLILEIFSYQAGLTEKQASSLITGMIMGGASAAATAATGGTAAALKGAAGMAAGVMGNAGGSGGSGGSGGGDQGQAHRG